MADESGEKTEEPTHRKLEEARKKGQVWKSRDLTGALVFLGGFAVMVATFPTMLARFREVLQGAMAKVAGPVGPQAVAQALYDGMTAMLLLTLPIVVACAAIGALADVLQVGAMFTLEPLSPKLEKLNPIEGLKKLFSKKQLVELLKSTVKLTLAAYVAYTVLRGELRLIVSSARASPGLILEAAGSILWKLATRIGMLLALFAVFDLWWQRRSFMKDQMMTKEEVKREYKESEGDPHHKAKRKQLHREILESAMLNDVARADVVVTNPDHYAVALKYERAQDGAPRVLAKGMDSLAQQIKALARGADVPMVEDKPLARALFRVELGDEIPDGLFDAVAEILSFVYAQQRKQEGVAPSDW